MTTVQKQNAQPQEEYAAHPVLERACLVFTPATHRYYLAWTPKEGDPERASNIKFLADYSERISGVNEMIERYFPKFDAAAISGRAAEREGVAPETIRARWAAAAAAASGLGTRVHANQEAMLQGKKPPHMPEDDRERAIMTAGWQAVQWLRQAGWEPLYIEKKIFSPSMKLAGTVDAVLHRKGGYLILDWKTNKALEERSRHGNHALPPIAHLDDCNMAHYHLQLAVYRRILEAEGYITGIGSILMALCHLAPAGPRAIKLADTPDADRILNHHLTHLPAYQENIPF
jgi:hypothetical protein